MTERPERELILRAANGDKQAFGDLYEKYLVPIYRFVFLRVSHEQEAEDLTEEVFMRVWQTLPRMKQESEIQDFRSWVYRIARNLVIDHYRKKKMETSIEEISVLQDKRPQPDAVVQEDEERKKLLAAIQELDGQLGDVLINRFINGLSHAETAHVMGLKENHIRILQYRALKKVRSWMATGGKR